MSSSRIKSCGILVAEYTICFENKCTNFAELIHRSQFSREIYVFMLKGFYALQQMKYCNSELNTWPRTVTQKSPVILNTVPCLRNRRTW